MQAGTVVGSLCTKKNCDCKHNKVRPTVIAPDLHYVDFIIPITSFELYFMGVRLYSKYASKKWPDLDVLAATAKEAYDGLLEDPAFDLYYNFDAKEVDTSHINQAELTREQIRASLKKKMKDKFKNPNQQ